MDGTVLVADDDRTIRTVLTQALTRAGCKVHATSSLVTLMRWIEEGRGDLVISDVVMPDGNGLETIPKIAALRPGLPVIIISAQNTILTAIRAEEAAAHDYLPKPFDLPVLMKRAARALAGRVLHPAPVRDPALADDLPLVGRTAQMQALYRLVARVKNAELAVLITGESGTGKSLIARTIHDFSDRRAAPLVTASAGDLAAVDGLAALAGRARGGTILFEEVGEFGADAQLRITRLLDAFTEDAPRVMATSQVDLNERIAGGVFRPDLFYRLSGVTIAVPPLRERIDDIALLCTHFLDRIARDGGARKTLSASALAPLHGFDWPGNVRQLENTLRRLAITSPEEEISLQDAAAALEGQGGAATAHEPRGGERLSASIGAHLRHYFEMHGGALPPPGLYQRILHETELPLISIALEATGGNQARCAELLGINRNTLRKKITELDIRVTRRRKLM